MIGLDTNVLVRHLAEDDEAQTDTAHRLLTAARAEGEVVYISLVVLCEAHRVLRSSLGRPRAEIAQAFDSLLSAEVFQVEEPDIVRRALESCRSGKGDFADYLIGHLNASRGCRHTATFDRALRGTPEFKVL